MMAEESEDKFWTRIYNFYDYNRSEFDFNKI